MLEMKDVYNNFSTIKQMYVGNNYRDDRKANVE